MRDDLITFVEPSYALYSQDMDAILTTASGHIAIFNTRNVAEYMARITPGNVIVVPVSIKPIRQQDGN